MYAKVLECHSLGEKKWMIELQLDQKGLKANSILSSQKTKQRWTVDSRVLYSQFRGLHKRFPYERIKVMRLNIPEGDLEKLKLDLCKREDEGIFQYIIKGTSLKAVPEIGEELLCAGY